MSTLAGDRGPFVFSWVESPGEMQKVHVVYIDDRCIAFALNLTDAARASELVRAAKARPDLAADLVAQYGSRYTRDWIACVKFTERHNVLEIVTHSDEQVVIPNGGKEVQENILASVSRAFGVPVQTERATIRSSLAGLPFGALIVTSVIGGLLLLFTVFSSPGERFHGRYRVLKVLFNEIGVAIKESIGIAGACAVLVAVFLAVLTPWFIRVARRPKSQVVRP